MGAGHLFSTSLSSPHAILPHLTSSPLPFSLHILVYFPPFLYSVPPFFPNLFFTPLLFSSVPSSSSSPLFLYFPFLSSSLVPSAPNVVQLINKCVPPPKNPPRPPLPSLLPPLPLPTAACFEATDISAKLNRSLSKY